MKLNNLRVGGRLAMGFGLVLMMTVMMAVIGALQTSKVKDKFDDVALNVVPSLQQLGAMGDAIDNVRRNELRYTLETTAEGKERVGKDLDASKAAFQKAHDAYKELISDETDRQLWDAADVAAQSFFKSADEFKAMSQPGEDFAKIKPAIDRVNGLEYEAYKVAMAAAQKDLEYNLKLSDAAIQEGKTAYVSAMWMLGACLILALALGTAAAWVIARSVTVPLTEAIGITERVAAGVFNNHLDTSRSDELGQLSRALSKMQTSLSGVIDSIRSAAESVTSASGQIAAGNQDLSSRTEHQASSLQQTAASMQQLTENVQHNTDSARQAAELAGGVAHAAERGSDVVGRVVDTMHTIQQSSHKISEIIGVIDGIAFQTNILALNAAVEAARAGEQGRGFAVVASEVRSLAQRSANAAKEIKTLITDSVEHVNTGAGLVGDAGKTMDELQSQVRRVTDLMSEIRAASIEQSNSLGQVNQAVNQLDQTTQQNAALVEESAAAAESLRQQADRMLGSISTFKTQG